MKFEVLLLLAGCTIIRIETSVGEPRNKIAQCDTTNSSIGSQSSTVLLTSTSLATPNTTDDVGGGSPINSTMVPDATSVIPIARSVIPLATSVLGEPAVSQTTPSPSTSPPLSGGGDTSGVSTNEIVGIAVGVSAGVILMSLLTLIVIILVVNSHINKTKVTPVAQKDGGHGTSKQQPTSVQHGQAVAMDPLPKSE